MQGKICLVTGATRGIGLVTGASWREKAPTSSWWGARASDAPCAMDQIRAAVPTSSIEWLVADLSSQAEVRRLAEEVRRSAAAGRSGQQRRWHFPQAAGKRRRN